MRALRSVLSTSSGIDAFTIAISLSEGNVLVANFKKHQPVSIQHIHGDTAPSNVIFLSVESSRDLVSVAYDNKKVTVYSTTTGLALGTREVLKKGTTMLFAGVNVENQTKDILLISDKFGDVWASPLSDFENSVKHILGHTATCITCMAMVSFEGEKYLITGDRAEHVRISRFPKTPLIQTILVGHTDYITDIDIDESEGKIITASADGTVSLWGLLCGKRICTLDLEVLLKNYNILEQEISSIAQIITEKDESDSDGQNEDSMGFEPERLPSRNIYPVCVSVCPKTKLIVTVIHNLDGKLVVLKLKSDEKEEKKEFALAYIIQLPEKLEVLGIGFADNTLFVAVPGFEPLLAYTLGEHRADAVNPASDAGKVISSICSKAKELGFSIESNASFLQNQNVSGGLKKKIITAEQQEAQIQSTSHQSYMKRRFRGNCTELKDEEKKQKTNAEE